MTNTSTAIHTDDSSTQVSNPGQLLRIQAILQELIKEVHGLKDHEDPAILERLSQLDKVLTQQLDAILDEPLSRELHHLIGRPPTERSTPDDVRIALAQLEGWVEGLLAGMATSVALSPLAKTPAKTGPNPPS